jgi:hypothetical protein
MKKRFTTLSLVLGSALGLFTLAAAVIGITSTPALAACSALPSTLGTVTLSVAVPATGSYRVWVRELAPSTSTGGFYLQIADAGVCQDTMGNATLAANTWTWVDYQNANPATPVSATLSGGSHQIVLAGLHSGVELAKIELLSDATCTPTGDGTNCTQAAVGTPAPTNSPTSSPVTVPVSTGGGSSSSNTTPVSGDINVTPTNLPSDVVSTQYFVDGKPVASGQIDTADLSNGKHTVEVIATTADGQKIIQTSVITVNNHKTWQQQLVAAFQSHRPEVVALAILIIALPLLWFINYRYGFIGRLYRKLHPDPFAAVTPVAPVVGSPSSSLPSIPTGQTPETPVVYQAEMPKIDPPQ